MTNWKLYKQMNSEEKEEYNFRFKDSYIKVNYIWPLFIAVLLVTLLSFSILCMKFMNLDSYNLINAADNLFFYYRFAVILFWVDISIDLLRNVIIGIQEQIFINKVKKRLRGNNGRH